MNCLLSKYRQKLEKGKPKEDFSNQKNANLMEIHSAAGVA
jgi:hypothetical protein